MLSEKQQLLFTDGSGTEKLLVMLDDIHKLEASNTLSSTGNLTQNAGRDSKSICGKSHFPQFLLE